MGQKIYGYLLGIPRLNGPCVFILRIRRSAVFAIHGGGVIPHVFGILNTNTKAAVAAHFS